MLIIHVFKMTRISTNASVTISNVTNNNDNKNFKAKNRTLNRLLILMLILRNLKLYITHYIDKMTYIEEETREGKNDEPCKSLSASKSDQFISKEINMVNIAMTFHIQSREGVITKKLFRWQRT